MTSSDSIVLRIAGPDETYLPPAIVANPEILPLLRRGSIGGRLTAESKQALLDFYGGTPESEAAVMRGLKWLAAHQQSDGSWPLKDYAKGIPGCDCQGEFEKEVDDSLTAGTAFGVLPFLGAGVTHNRAPDQAARIGQVSKGGRAGLDLLGPEPDPRQEQGRQERRLSGRQHVRATPWARSRSARPTGCRATNG